MSTSNPSNNITSPGGETEGGGEPSQSSPRQRQKRQPSLLDSLLVEPAHNATGAGFGILCNDPSGLCLSATGSFVSQESTTVKSNNNKYANVDDSVNSGVYTSLTKLAQQLQPGSSENASTGSGGGAAAAPLITIETEDCNFLIKEYDGHAIAIKVPAATTGTPNNANGGSSGGGGASDSNGVVSGAGASN